MNAIVFEHVPVSDLPEPWRRKIAGADHTLVTVRIEQEMQAAVPEPFTTDDPAFGIWSDRSDMADVAGYVRQLREPRYGRDGTRHEP